MAFDPSKYVYQPRPLQQFDFGSGFRDLAEARFNRQKIDNQDRQAREGLAEQKAGRGDMNTRFSATIASDRSAAEFDVQQKRNARTATLVEQARKAANARDWNTADSLLPQILEMGGKAEKVDSPNGPVYRFEAPALPSQNSPDFGGTRQRIFGGDPVGQPGSPGQNPYDRLPGASAAAAGPPPPPATPDPGPPPGAATDAPPADPNAPIAPGSPELDTAVAGLESAVSAHEGGVAPEQPPASEPQSMQLTPPNPFDPFKIDPATVTRQNELRLKPFLDGAQASIPGIYQPRLNKLNAGASSLPGSPEDIIKMWQPAYNTAAGLMKSETAASAARASQGMRGQAMDFSQNQRLRDFAARRVANVQKQFNTFENYKRFEQIEGVNQLLNEGSQGNGQADVLALSTLRNLYQSGVMTDKDFEQVKGGIRTIWQKIKDGTIESLFANGINPDARANLRAIVRIANQRSRGALERARDQMLTRASSDRTVGDEERQEIITATAEMIPESLWSPQLREWMGVPVEQKTGPMDQSGNYQVGKPQPGATQSKSGSVSRSQRGPAADKPVEALTEEELSKELQELLK